VRLPRWLPTELQLVAGVEGIVNVWDFSTENIKQTIRVGSPVLALNWVNIQDNLMSFLAGAADGSITCFVVRLPSNFVGCRSNCPIQTSQKDDFRLAFRTYLPGVTNYMHIDSLNKTFAAVGGDGLSIWSIKMMKTKSDIKFSLSETPIPRDQVTAVGQAHAAARPRTLHFLPRDQGVLVAFVSPDIMNMTSHL
jgi:WD40 repeat protein